jgi:hypothetical protein
MEGECIDCAAAMPIIRAATGSTRAGDRLSVVRAARRYVACLMLRIGRFPVRHLPQKTR